MFLEIQQRTSDSPFIERVWTCHSNGGQMTSVASATWDLCFWEYAGDMHATVHGPETHATWIPVPSGAEFFGISFALGSVMPHLAPSLIVDGTVDIPDAEGRRFHLAGSSWLRPDYDSAEDFVAQLAREDLVVRDPLVADQLEGAPTDVTTRTVQRRFRAATGLTPGTVRQIERARHAAMLIQGGRHLEDVVHRLGFYDGPHLRRSLNRFIGWTPQQLRTPQAADQMSLLYTTWEPRRS